MDIQEALDRTLKAYNIKAKHLAATSGVTERQISLFRNKNADIFAVKGLQELLKAMDARAPGSKQYFCSLLTGGSLKAADWRSLILSASHEDIEEILHLLAERWTIIQKNCGSTDKNPATLAR